MTGKVEKRTTGVNNSDNLNDEKRKEGEVDEDKPRRRWLGFDGGI